MANVDVLEAVKAQERRLQFDRFGSREAWLVGSALREAAVQKNAAMSFEIQVAGRVLFACTTFDPPAGQMDWIRRKRNVVMRFGRASYGLGLELAATGKSLEERHGLTLAEYAMHGGGFPIALRGTGCVGSVVASGLAQEVDHQMVVTALAGVFGVELPVG